MKKDHQRCTGPVSANGAGQAHRSARRGAGLMRPPRLPRPAHAEASLDILPAVNDGDSHEELA